MKTIDNHEEIPVQHSFRHQPPALLFREHYEYAHFIQDCAHVLYSTLLSKINIYDIVIVCIGTDRSTGDALGPIIGSKLEQLSRQEITVYGTLDHPVHAVNLEETLDEIRHKHIRPYIIAIDACLGEMSHIGTVAIGEGPLKPGSGVQKQLPEVGDVHLTGIVNVSGFMEYFVLQNTRLSLVMNIANKIASSIDYANTLLATEQQPMPSHLNHKKLPQL